ncbi:MAG: hypothetical protein KDD43_07370 [Bdellovibrionales bacterium]|nr:hypothetical protein [Bdellovibrionales bacterium]
MSCLVTFSSFASASKLDIMAGWFSISAKTNSGSSELSNFGAYRINYFIPVFRQLDLTVGYSLLMSDTFGGDLGYGVDGGVTYYPISNSRPIKADSENARMVVDSLWRPYAGLGFSQRQFQSVQSTYAGFSLFGGVERSLMREFDFKAELRIVELQGAGVATATEMTLVAGIIYLF